jgi:hypothetical protein
MGVRFPFVFTGTVLNPLPASAVETLFFTTPPFSPAFDFAVILVEAFLAITAGTGTTSVSISIRRGTLVTSPTLLGLTPFTVAAGNSAMLRIVAQDTSGPLANVQYSMTVVQTGATAAGVANAGLLWAYSL